MNRVKVALYEDNKELRALIVDMLRNSDEIALSGDYNDCLQVIEQVKSTRPEVIIMDIDMPGKSGIEGVREIKQFFPETEVIMHTVFEDDERIFQALQAGATGYLLKKHSIDKLIDAVIEVKNGGAPMSTSIARRVLQYTTYKLRGFQSHQLTEKEMEIIQLLSKGLSYKMAAAELRISIDLVRYYIKKIYEKLHVHSITEAVHKIYIKE